MERKPHDEKIFQLTPSRRATHWDIKVTARNGISTHALTEGDGHSVSDHPDPENISTHALTEGD